MYFDFIYIYIYLFIYLYRCSNESLCLQPLGSQVQRRWMDIFVLSRDAVKTVPITTKFLPKPCTPQRKVGQFIIMKWGTAVSQWLRCCATNQKVSVSIPASVSEFFIDIKSFRSHYGPGVDSGSNRNEYRGHILGVKSGRRLRLTTLPPSCAVVTKSGNLNFLRTLWACPGLNFF